MQLTPVNTKLRRCDVLLIAFALVLVALLKLILA